MATVLKKKPDQVDVDGTEQDLLEGIGESLTPARGPRRIATFWKKPPPQDEEEQFVPDSAQWSQGSRLATKAITVLLGGALLCGPAALALAFDVLRPAPAQVAASSGYDQRMMNRRDAAINFALGAVPTWLRADRTHTQGLGSYWNVSQLQGQLPVTGATVTEPRLYSATASAPGVWSVVVSATVNDATTRRYFQLPVAVAGFTLPAVDALTLPAEIAAPSARVNLSVRYDTQVDPSSQAALTVTQFLQAQLIGQGNITRYTRPGVSIAAVTPSPWSAVTVQQLKTTGTGAGLVDASSPVDGSVVRLSVTAGLTPAAPGGKTPPPSGSSTPSTPGWPGAATTPAPTPASPPSGTPPVTTGDLGQVPVQYQLSLTARDGRWEVSALDPAPVTSTPQQ